MNPHPPQLIAAHYTGPCTRCPTFITPGERIIADEHTPGRWRHVTCPPTDAATAVRGAALVREAIRNGEAAAGVVTIYTPWGEYQSMDDYLDDGDYRPWPWVETLRTAGHLQLVAVSDTPTQLDASN